MIRPSDDERRDPDVNPGGLAPRDEARRADDRPLGDPALDPSGGVGDLGEESGTAPWQPAGGTRAIAPRAGEGLWVG